MGQFSATNTYLLLYNNFCCALWSYVLANAILSIPLFSQGGLVIILQDDALLRVLTVVQCAAILEIVHCALGLVRSPVVTTGIQVGSRVSVLWFLINSPLALESLGGSLMVLSWALVEVPRYAFYTCALVTGDATKKTPYALFWLRYTLFAVLYPSGITGEILTYCEAFKDPSILSLLGNSGESIASLLWYIMLLIYIVGSPVMIMNMASNRAKAFKKRNAKPPPPPRGLVFPLDAKNVRSSTSPAKTIYSAALYKICPDKAQAVLEEKNWRFKYVRHLLGLVQEQCSSPQNALAIAQAGLDKAHEVFQFVSPDGSSLSLEEAMAASNSESFFTGFVQGKKTMSSSTTRIEVPYKGKILHGQSLKDQVNKWVDYGTIEPSAGKAICHCVDHQSDWLDKPLKDRYFCLLGAGSAMGPFQVLMSLGANIIAIDLDRPNIWKRLISVARNSTGTLTFPTKVDTSNFDDDATYASSGCNLFTETPLIRDWLLQLYPNKPMTVGCYAYLNGALHVQVSLAMDAICKDLSEKRPNTSLAYLCTPTDLHLTSKEAWEDSLKHYGEYSKRTFCFLLHALSRGKYLRKNARKPVFGEGGKYYIVNGISVAQGPNYALAKRLQHWRAIVARSKNCFVSSNIAPATSTASVVHKREFAWAYEGMPYFMPYEIFAPETSNAVMTALLLHDLFSGSEDNVSNPETKLNNPNQLFQFGSFNGGAWRCAYEVDSIGEASVLRYFGRIGKPYLQLFIATAGIVAALKFSL